MAQDQRIQQINRDLDAATGQMAENIDNMTANLATAEEIQEQTDRLKQNADQFKKSSTRLKKEMKWKNAKLWFMIGGIALVILIIIIVIIVIAVTATSDNKK